MFLKIVQYTKHRTTNLTEIDENKNELRIENLKHTLTHHFPL